MKTFAIVLSFAVLCGSGCITQPALGPANSPITITSKYAAKCPYCEAVCISRSCWPSGGTIDTNGVHVQTWVISYRCKGCYMQFGDTRSQTLPAVNSVRLPTSGKSYMPQRSTIQMPPPLPPPSNVRKSPRMSSLVVPLVVDGASVLTVGLTNVDEEMAVMDLRGHFPGAILPAAGGQSYAEVICITGSAYQLSVNTETNVAIEYSTNLVQWSAFPSVGYQLTMNSTSPPFVNELVGHQMYFRTKQR